MPALTGSSFSSGGAGFAWVTAFLKKRHFIEWDLGEELSDLDEFLFTEAMAQLQADALDYLHGSMGILHYFTTRMDEVKIMLYADTFIEALYAKAIRDDKGIRFRSFITKPVAREEYNFSLSHGLSGMLMILMNAWPLSKNKKMIEEMVADGVKYLLHYRKDIDYDNEQYNFFPFTINEQTRGIVESNRLAWCYGDLNQVLLLNRAGKLLKQNNYIRLAQLIGLQTLMRNDYTMTLAGDSHFCHGTAGLAQVYKILYDATDQPGYKKGQDFWIEQTILFLEKELPAGKYKGHEHDLLEGLPGVGLTLLSYISEQPLDWSTSLLL
jgi:lantibiotic modifying enzyme